MPMADRELIPAIILAGLLAKYQGTTETPASLMGAAIDAAD
jgi:hypothetical protein